MAVTVSINHEGVIEVVDKTPLHGSRYMYFDLKRNLKSISGRQGDLPGFPMTPSEIQWVQEKYAKLAVHVDDIAKAQFQALVVLATAGMINDGLYDSMSRQERASERARRVENMRKNKKKVTESEYQLAQRIISRHEASTYEHEQLTRPMGLA